MGVEISYQQISPYYKRSPVSVFNHLATSGRYLLLSVTSSNLYIIIVNNPGVMGGLSTDNRKFPDI